MRSILCQADTLVDSDAPLETALALARCMDGHLCVQVASPSADVAMFEPFGGTALTAVTIEEARHTAVARADALDARLAREDVPFDVSLVAADRFEGLVAAARLADVTVLSREDPLLEDLALAGRFPVLAVPDGPPLTLFDGPAMIAWDGGAAAANALRAALPLLRRSVRVEMVTVHERSDQALRLADPALRYLARHDVHAELHIESPDRPIAEVLCASAARLGAAMVVMGLYGHSRLRELLIGGSTRSMLGKCDRPLLLAH